MTCQKGCWIFDEVVNKASFGQPFWLLLLWVSQRISLSLAPSMSEGHLTLMWVSCFWRLLQRSSIYSTFGYQIQSVSDGDANLGIDRLSCTLGDFTETFSSPAMSFNFLHLFWFKNHSRFSRPTQIPSGIIFQCTRNNRAFIFFSTKRKIQWIFLFRLFVIWSMGEKKCKNLRGKIPLQLSSINHN